MGKSHSEGKLRKASDHLYYEMWMLNQLADILEKAEEVAEVAKYDTYTSTTETYISKGSIGVDKSSFPSQSDEIQRTINNAILESFAIHTRSLLDFFYSSGSRDDDVVAEHFFSSATVWISARPPKTYEQRMRIKDRVSKEIAHLTIARQNVKSKKWPYKSIRRDLNRAFSVFFKIVPDNLLGKRWK